MTTYTPANAQATPVPAPKAGLNIPHTCHLLLGCGQTPAQGAHLVTGRNRMTEHGSASKSGSSHHSYQHREAHSTPELKAKQPGPKDPAV